jgi:hypothetical protein
MTPPIVPTPDLSTLATELADTVSKNVPGAVHEAVDTAIPGVTHVHCDVCGLRHILETSGLCPNNNCPAHYRSYAEFRAVTGQIIPSLEPQP